MTVTISREILLPAVVRYDFSKDLAKETISQLNRLKEDHWTDSMVGSGDLRKHVRSSKNINLDQLDPDLSKKIRKYLYACIKDYSNIYDIQLFSDEGLVVLKYEDFDKYEYHTDNGPDIDRSVSILIYLNPKKYEGGQTHFKFFDYAVDPDTPSLVVFPSNYPYRHAAMPVTDGVKYIIVSWLSDKPKDLMKPHGSGCACSRE